MNININIKKFLTENIYRLVKIPVKPCVISKYKPIILNKELVPDKESIVFAPNHRQTNDAFLMFSSIDKPVHWMALKRFFTGEDSIFNNNKNPILCKMTALVFNGIGAVPIIRDQDIDKYPNQDNSISLKEFDMYLKLKSSIGIFPEGTTNKEPEKQNLLSPKKSAFYFAKDNNSYIQPISITWIPKSLNIQNRAIINYRQPFKSTEMNVQEMIECWIQSVNEGLEENKQIVENLKNLTEIVNVKKESKKLELVLRK